MSGGAPRVKVVVDLGFGDAGKGLLTDFLVRESGAKTVVRYNGGAQAGHNVVAPDGRHHTFSQFGAGSFVPGVKTFLSRHVVVHPTALLVEAAALAAKGVDDPLARLRLSDGALVVTPYHQAAGRLRELARGAARHGSCGAGVGEAVADRLAQPADAVCAGDLGDPARLLAKLARLRERKRAECAALLAAVPASPAAARERAVFERRGLAAEWSAAAARLVDAVAPDELLAAWLRPGETAVFEGAQGVLLDERYGFHPYTTWSRCGTENAKELLAEAAPGAAVEWIGVLRSYAVRHGPGPLPTETAELRPAIREHNRAGEWQGEVRYGWFDAVLARHALDLSGPLDTLAMTHLDVPPRRPAWRQCTGYETPSGPEAAGLAAERDAAGLLTRLAAERDPPLARQERLTALLLRVRPRLEPSAPTEEAVIEQAERLLGQSIGLVSRGPRAADVARR